MNWVNIRSGNGLSPVRRHTITWTNAGLLAIGLPGTNFSEIWIGILVFSLKKMHLKISFSGRWVNTDRYLTITSEIAHTVVLPVTTLGSRPSLWSSHCNGKCSLSYNFLSLWWDNCNLSWNYITEDWTSTVLHVFFFTVMTGQFLALHSLILETWLMDGLLVTTHQMCVCVNAHGLHCCGKWLTYDCHVMVNDYMRKFVKFVKSNTAIVLSCTYMFACNIP